MSDKIQAPWVIQWFGELLRAIPAPNEAWASIIGSVVWPALVLFIILRFRAFLRTFLTILLDRLPHDHLKIGMFELRPNDQVLVLDREGADGSTEPLEPADVNRIERIFEFIADDEGLDRLVDWLVATNFEHIDIVDFVTLPQYATERERACNEIEGLKG